MYFICYNTYNFNLKLYTESYLLIILTRVITKLFHGRKETKNLRKLIIRIYRQAQFIIYYTDKMKKKKKIRVGTRINNHYCYKKKKYVVYFIRKLIARKIKKKRNILQFVFIVLIIYCLTEIHNIRLYLITGNT